ncbi:MAG: haloacid dehalogenase-like hydrolase [Atopobiaceae bacterium]|nr:haloacid dehalogenase-like hydrolase [Atopobiaceae bacterium]
MENEKTVPSWWRIAAIVAAAACVVLAVLFATKPAGTPDPAKSSASASEQKSASSANLSLVKDGEDPLSLWNDNAPLKKKLTEYVKAATDEKSPDFIPVEDRVATFDFDGTLFCETDPNYFDYTMLVYRVTEDPTYKDKASDFEKSVANKIIDQNTNGTKYEELPLEHGQAVASAFKGMTIDEFYNYVHEFMKQPMPSYTGMTRGGGFYQPMVQVVQYLQANDFDVYIMTGTDRLILRGIFSDPSCPIKLPLNHILGSDESLVGSNQGDKDGLDYTFTQEDKLVTGGTFMMKTLKENKCYIIQREVGKQPVLSFGNSSGDFAMDNYAKTNPTYKSAAFQLCCDDLERENGNEKKAKEMLENCEKNDYVPVSMKDDWKTIYGEGVTYNGAKKSSDSSASSSSSSAASSSAAADSSSVATESSSSAKAA